MAALALAATARGQDEQFNYDESKVQSYTLPDPLIMQDGRPVSSAAMWRNERRGEILQLFESQVYGRRPNDSIGMRFRVTESREILGGKGRRKRIQVDFFDRRDSFPGFAIHLITPRGAGPAPAFVGMHLFDTAAAEAVPGKLLEAEVGRPLPGTRLLETILERGYAIATLDAKDFCPDDKLKFREGVLSHLYPGRVGPPGPEEPGAIATWAWGLSRTLDYFYYDRNIDAHRVAVIGHSRMGKTARMGRRRGPAIRTGYFERLGLRRRGAKPAEVRRDGQANQSRLSTLVLRELFEIRQPRGPTAGRSTRVDCPDCAAARVCRQRAG